MTRKALVKRLTSTALQTARSGETAIEMLYPMWLMPVHEFMTLSELRPHQELVAAGKLVKWDAAMENIFFLSHQWTSFDRPDHSTSQLRTVQKALVRMLCGKLPTTAPQFADAIHLPSKVKISPAEWKELVPQAHIWMDFISVRPLCESGDSLCLINPFVCVAGPASQHDLYRIEHRRRWPGERFDESREFDPGLCRA